MDRIKTCIGLFAAVVIFCSGVFVGYLNFKPEKAETIAITETIPQQHSIIIPIDKTNNDDLYKRAQASILVDHEIDGTDITGRAYDGYKATTFHWKINSFVDATSNNFQFAYYPNNKFYDASYIRQWNLIGIGGGVLMKEQTKFSDVRIIINIKI